MRVHIIFIICLIQIGCSPDSQKNIKEVQDTIYQIKLVESLNIELGEFVYSSYSKHQIWDDSLFFGLSPAAEPNTISVFNLKSEQFIKKIKIDRNFFKSDISSFYAHNPDSIYFFPFNQKIFI